MNLQNEVFKENENDIKETNIKNEEMIKINISNSKSKTIEDSKVILERSSNDGNRKSSRKRTSILWSGMFSLEDLKYKSLNEALEDGKNTLNSSACSIFKFNLPSNLRIDLGEKLNLNNNSKDETGTKDLLSKIGINELKKTIESHLGKNNSNFSLDDSIIIFNDMPINVTWENYIETVSERVKDIFHFDKLDDVKKIQMQNLLEEYSIKISKQIKTKSKNISGTSSCLNEFNKIFLESFILFFINVIIYFEGLKCSVYFDPFHYLNVEFYGDSDIFMKIAEKQSYALQLKINSNFKIFDTENTNTNIDDKSFTTWFYDDKLKTWKEVKNINEKNQTPNEYINESDISFFPPHMRFDKKKADYFRRYTSLDQYHDCEFEKICEQSEEEKAKLLAKEDEEENNLTNECIKECDIFRNIDKLRLIDSSIHSIININNLKKNNFFFKQIFLRNDDEYEKLFDSSNFIKNYFNVFETKSVKKNNHFIRNYLGEYIGYYFLFTTHFLKWLLIPTFFGILLYILSIILPPILKFSNLIKESETLNRSNYKTIWNLIYTCAIIVWGCIYTKSWGSNEKFYNYVWGMNEYEGGVNELAEVSISKFMLYQGVRVPIISKFNSYMKRLITILINISMIVFTIIFNLFLFYISNTEVFNNPKIDIHNKSLSNYDKMKNSFTQNSEKNENNEIQSAKLYYIILISSVLIRKILSAVNYNVATWCCYYESHDRKENFQDSFLVKVTSFEFVNYYMTFFYVAYFKQYYGKCANNDCFGELGDQLVIILITTNILNLLEIGIPFIKKLTKAKFLKKIILDNLISNFSENDTRITSFYKDDYDDFLAYEYLEIIMYYGYVILFGVTSKSCFLLAFLSVFIERLVDSYKLIKLHNVCSIEGAKGIGVVHKILKVFTFFGIITNSTITFFTIDFVQSSPYKWPFVFIIENIMVFVLLILNFDSTPAWFAYLDKIKFNYIKRIFEYSIWTEAVSEKNEQLNKTEQIVKKFLI